MSLPFNQEFANNQYQPFHFTENNTYQNAPLKRKMFDHIRTTSIDSYISKSSYMSFDKGHNRTDSAIGLGTTPLPPFAALFTPDAALFTPDAAPAKKRGGSDDLHNALINRYDMAKLHTNREKIAFLVKLEHHIPRNMSTLTENARNFVNICLPILHCFHHHHQSNIERFEHTYDKGFSYTTFRKVHCNMLNKGQPNTDCCMAMLKRQSNQNAM
jgi:hypothetical protein